MTGNRCVILVPVNGSPLPECDEGLRELERRGYPVWRIRGYSAIDAARCQMATDALAQGYEELFWIDADIAFNPDDVDKLRRHQLPFVCGLYAKKGARQIAGNFLPGTQKILFGKHGSLHEIQACGFGFTLTRREVYEAIEQGFQLPTCNERFGKKLVPYFWPTIATDGPGATTYLAEDLAFCARARQVGYPAYADTSVRLWHVGHYRYGWEDAGSDKVRFEDYLFKLPAITERSPTTVPSLTSPEPLPAGQLPRPLLATDNAPQAALPRHPFRPAATERPAHFPQFQAYIVTYAANLDSARLTLEDFRRSDWGEPPHVVVQPEEWPIDLDSAAANYKRALLAAWESGCDFALILEDDVRVCRHLRANLLTLPLIQRDQCDFLSLYIPDLIASPWERTESHLGYRLARPLYSGPNQLWTKHRLWGSQAYVLSRRFVKAALERWDSLSHGLDTRAISVCSQWKLPMWYTSPSWVEHAPLRSAHATPTAKAPDFQADFRLMVQPGFQPPEAIPGWFTLAECELLWQVACGRTVLELGTAAGQATVSLAQQAQHVVTLDLADQHEAQEWVNRYGLQDRVQFRQGYLGEVRTDLTDGFEVIVLNHHKVANTLRLELEQALPLLKPNGQLVFSHYPDPATPSIRKLVDELAQQGNWKRKAQVDYLGVFEVPAQKPLAAPPTGQALSDDQIRAYFQPRWTPEERLQARDLLQEVGELLNELAIPWFLYAGTLLGYVRQGGLLDWDDDLDVIVLKPIDSDRLRVLAETRGMQLMPHPYPGNWKLFRANAPRLSHQPWGFPFVDLLSSEVNERELVHHSVWGGDHKLPLAEVLPLRQGLFEGIPVKVPNSPMAMCQRLYHPDCLHSAVPPSWDHRGEKPTNYPKVRVSLARIRSALAHSALLHVPGPPAN